MLLKIVFIVIQIFMVDSWRQCDSCITHLSCQEAYNIKSFFKSSETLLKLYQSLCGYDGSGPMVCCADFVSLFNRINSETDDDSFYIKERIELLPKECGNDMSGEDRIYGGTIADLLEFPWMALISTYIEHDVIEFTCDGTIINSKYVLTAAHCVVEKSIAGVRVGEYKIDGTDCFLDSSICMDSLQNLFVEESIPHEKYLSNKNKHAPSFDIALLRVEGEIDLSQDNILPICLPLHNRLRHSGILHKEATVAGWGKIETGSISTELLKVKVKIVNDTSCQGVNNALCAGSKGKDSCSADSGGPLMIRDPVSTRYYQFGIVSAGNAVCGTDAAIYTDVRQYIDWILEHIEN